MSYYKIGAIVLLLFVSIYGKSQVVQQSGSIYSEMAATISGMPGDSGNQYVLPSPTQLTNWGIVLNNVILGNYSFASSIASSVGYQLVQFTDTFLVPNRTYYILRNNSSNYWGTYVYYPAYKRPLVIQSPHAKKDANTGHQGAYVFRQSESMLFMLTGTHRCNSSVHSVCTGTTTGCSSTSEPYRISDLAHNVNSVFQKTTEVFHASFSNTYFIQLHGFTKQPTDPYLVLSNGTQVTPAIDYMATFKNMLYNEDTVLTFKVAHLDLSWTRLRGFWNTQGRLINASSNPCTSYATNSQGRFFHVEQERIRLRSTVSGWAKISNALINTFPPTPLPVTFIDLKAQWQGTHATLQWTTSSEHNADRFLIERSLDGIQFENIGEVKAKGSVYSSTDYHFTDRNAHLLTGIKIYYRLKQYDVDQRSIFSKSVLLNNKGGIVQYEVYPNPASNKIFIKTKAKRIKYEIRSLLGQKMRSGILENTNQTIDIANLPDHIYFIRLGDEVLRFIKE